MPKLKRWQVIGAIILTLAACFATALFLGAAAPVRLTIWVLGAWLLVLAIVWAARTLDPHVWILAGLVVLIPLFLPANLVLAIFSNNPSLPEDAQTAVTYFLAILPALVIAPLLIYSGASSLSLPRPEGAGETGDSRSRPRFSRMMSGVSLVLAVALVAAVIYDYYWFIVWDTTGDSLDILWLILPSLVVFIAGGALFDVLRGRARWAAVAYLLLIPILFAVSQIADGVNFRQLTLEHAAQTSQAIESYYAREGRYPQDLGQLVPRDALALPGPVILYGQNWCYDGSSNYYRLGYVYREHWSNPRLLGRLYTSMGPVPDLPALCAAEIAALEKRYTWFARW